MLALCIVSKETASESAENCCYQQPHWRLTPPSQGTAANICMSVILRECRVIGLHFCCW